MFKAQHSYGKPSDIIKTNALFSVLLLTQQISCTHNVFWLDFQNVKITFPMINPKNYIPEAKKKVSVVHWDLHLVYVFFCIFLHKKTFIYV